MLFVLNFATGNMIKNLLLAFIILYPCKIFAQLDSVEIGVNGLTCSMCSYSVEYSLKKLPEIRSVNMDLNSNIALVYFKAGEAVNFEALAKKVKESGFSVRSVSFALPENVKISEDGSFIIGAMEFYLLKENAGHNQSGRYRILNRSSMSKSDYKQMSSKIRLFEKKNKGKDGVYLVEYVVD